VHLRRLGSHLLDGSVPGSENRGENLPEDVAAGAPPRPPSMVEPHAEARISAAGADFYIDGNRLQIDPAPAQHAIFEWVGTAEHQVFQLLHLFVRQHRWTAAARRIAQSRKPVGIVAMYPFTQRLPIMPQADAASTHDIPSST
jgi:hypothetical protein